MPNTIIWSADVITFIYNCKIIYIEIENLVNECFFIYNLLHEGHVGFSCIIYVFNGTGKTRLFLKFKQ